MQEILGSFVQICCKVSGSIPIAVEWHKDGRKIFSGVKHKLIQQDNSVSVEIEQLEPSDAGRYSCKLTNAAGSCESSGSLQVKGQTAFPEPRPTVGTPVTFSVLSVEPPSFVSPPEPQSAVPNAKVRFKGTFKGTPPFTVQWFKDDRELMTGATCFTGVDGLSCFLELYSVSVSQSGVYSCQVSNAAGSARASANLTVKGWTFVVFAQLLCSCWFLLTRHCNIDKSIFLPAAAARF